MARQTKAKTAYELLERVCEAIKAHPKSYFQEWWACRRGAVASEGFCNPLPASLSVPENACGTAYCRAGWMVALHDGRKVAQSWNVAARAYKILAMPPSAFRDAEQLFDAEAVPGKPGTTAYVRDGVAGIRAFMKKHKAHLQARSLRGV